MQSTWHRGRRKTGLGGVLEDARVGSLQPRSRATLWVLYPSSKQLPIARALRTAPGSPSLGPLPFASLPGSTPYTSLASSSLPLPIASSCPSLSSLPSLEPFPRALLLSYALCLLRSRPTVLWLTRAPPYSSLPSFPLPLPIAPSSPSLVPLPLSHSPLSSASQALPRSRALIASPLAPLRACPLPVAVPRCGALCCSR